MGAMTHAWFDITAGVAGDMLLGSLLDAGADLLAVQRAVDAVIPDSVRLSVRPVTRCGQQASKVDVDLLVADPPVRTWASIRDLLERSGVEPAVRAACIATFRTLAEAESRTHGVPIEDVHFHEVGALDAIANVVGTCAALAQLGVTSVSASPVAVGSGRVRTAHGDLPVPVPAVARLLIGWTTVAPAPEVHTDPTISPSHRHPHVGASPDESVTPDIGPDQRPAAHHPHHGAEANHRHEGPAPLVSGGAGELATPTGLALVRALATRCEPLGHLEVTGLGVGAGGRDPADHPNVVRVLVGHPGEAGDARMREVAANVDDLDPRLWPGVLQSCLHAGAVDAWIVPIHMKKGRPAFTLHALVDEASHAAVVDTMLTRTTTLGVREVSVERTVLDRCWVDVDLGGEPVPVKVGSRDGRIVHAAVEFQAVRSLAERSGATEAEVLARATGLMVDAGLVPGAAAPAGRLSPADRGLS